MDTETALSLIALCYVLAFASGMRSRRADSGPDRSAEMGHDGKLFSLYVAWGLILWLTYGTGWTWEHVGVSPEVSPHRAVIAGAAVYLVVMVPCALVLRAAFGREREEDAVQRAMPAGATPFAVLVTCGINPVMEELIFRGIAVHLFDVTTGLTTLAVSMGCVACLCVHKYQGLAAVPFHAAFYACSLAVLYSPLGLLGCMGLHFVGDLVPTLSMLRRQSAAASSNGSEAT